VKSNSCLTGLSIQEYVGLHGEYRHSGKFRRPVAALQGPTHVRSWTTNTSHDVQISYSRDASGMVTYHSVWVDGVEQDLNATVSSAFTLGLSPTLLTNFQIDGLGASGSSVVYLDDLAISRW
jgi:hypothetical protein